MKITVISANTSARRDLKTEKGQSFYIQSKNGCAIYDFGSDRTMVKNAQTLGISLENADMGYLSCGNKLHSGGVEHFALANAKANLFARTNAFLPHYQKGFFGMKNLSLDRLLYGWSRTVHCKKYTIDDSENFVTFSLTEPNEKPTSPAPVNEKFFVKDDEGNYLLDDFSHEMYLLVKEGECWTLFCGDAHAGIVNIVERAEFLVNFHIGGKLTAVVGAFSLTINNKPVTDELIDQVANGLKDKDLIFYTGHTTGKYAFDRMKSALGDKLRFYAAGDEIVL